jgi:hypothetical protein
MKNKIENLELDVIATYDKPQVLGLGYDDVASFEETQEYFKIPMTEGSLKSEKSLIDYVKAYLDGEEDDLVKFSLCWVCDKELFEDFKDKYETISLSLHRNGKYAFNSWADEFSFKVDTFREFADFDRIVKELV